MSEYKTSDIIKDVRIAFDENKSGEVLAGTAEDILGLDEIIESKIADAINAVRNEAPLHLLEMSVLNEKSESESESESESGSESGSEGESEGESESGSEGESEGVSITWVNKTKGIGEINLPSDFLRYGFFKMSDWSHAVYNPISVNDKVYDMQFSEWAGVRGNASKPVVALGGASGEDNTTGFLQFFSSKTDAKPTLGYIVRCDGASSLSDQSSGYVIEDGIYRSVIIMIVQLVAAVFGMQQQGQK